MKDGLREAVRRIVLQNNPSPEVDYESADYESAEILEAVRDWLALPPSEEEIDAAVSAYDDFWQTVSGGNVDCAVTNDDDRDAIVCALKASRAVSIPPPEETT